MQLKSPDGTTKYKVNRIVCENKTLTFTMLKVSTAEEITVTMGIAPEGFTTDLFKEFSNTERQEVTAPPMPRMGVIATAQPASYPSSWICPCGTANSGNFCTACGHPRE